MNRISLLVFFMVACGFLFAVEKPANALVTVARGNERVAFTTDGCSTLDEVIRFTAQSHPFSSSKNEYKILHPDRFVVCGRVRVVGSDRDLKSLLRELSHQMRDCFTFDLDPKNKTVSVQIGQNSSLMTATVQPQVSNVYEMNGKRFVEQLPTKAAPQRIRLCVLDRSALEAPYRDLIQ